MKSISVKEIVFVSLVVLLMGVMAYTSFGKAQASAPIGLFGVIATTSNPVVTTAAAVAIATSTCSARIVTTASSSIMMTMSDWAGQTPTASFGHYQAASTTVAYDGGLYGCGLVKVYSFASQVITVSDVR